ncbi:MAG: VOC family protein [Actinobacteria bacterium]|nr:VOC family protein [Actinomycetota bacterium]
MRVTTINHVGVSVADMERSLGFYRDLLGLRVVLDLDVAKNADLDAVVGMPGTVGRAVFLETPGGDARLELWAYAAPAGIPVRSDARPNDHGVNHVSFEVEDADEVHARLAGAGYCAYSSPRDLGGFHRTFYVRGPDQEFVEFLEERTSPESVARALAEGPGRD